MSQNGIERGDNEPLKLPKGTASNTNPYPCFLGFFHPALNQVACGICLYSYSNIENWTCSIPLVPATKKVEDYPNSFCIQGGIKSPETEYQHLEKQHHPESLDAVCFYC